MATLNLPRIVLFFTEAHAKLLKECNQPIPNAVKILLDDARRREEKRHAKRIANRKSASTSRARKKQVCYLHLSFHSISFGNYSILTIY
jgi:lysyl-tRNA synthetase class II